MVGMLSVSQVVFTLNCFRENRKLLKREVAKPALIEPFHGYR